MAKKKRRRRSRNKTVSISKLGGGVLAIREVVSPAARAEFSQFNIQNGVTRFADELTPKRVGMALLFGLGLPIVGKIFASALGSSTIFKVGKFRLAA